MQAVYIGMYCLGCGSDVSQRAADRRSLESSGSRTLEASDELDCDKLLSDNVQEVLLRI